MVAYVEGGRDMNVVIKSKAMNLAIWFIWCASQLCFCEGSGSCSKKLLNKTGNDPWGHSMYNYLNVNFISK